MRSVNLSNLETKLGSIQLQELLTQKDKEIKELTKQVSFRDGLLKTHGLDQLCNVKSHREESLSQPKSLKTWKAYYGQKSKKNLKHTKAISNPVPLMFKVERLGSLPGQIGKLRKTGGSLGIKLDNPRKSDKIEKDVRNTAKSQKSRVNQSKKKHDSRKKVLNHAIKNERQTPTKKKDQISVNFDLGQRSHSAPHRTSLKHVAREAYYIGQGNPKAAIRCQDNGELDISFISLSSSDKSLNFNQNDLTLQKQLNPLEQLSERACEKRLTFTGTANLKGYSGDRVSTDPFYHVGNKENVEVDSKNFNSPCLFDISANESRLGLMELVNSDRKSIKIVDQFHLSNSKLLQDIELHVDLRQDAMFVDVKATKEIHHRRNSTKFNLLTHVSQRQDEIYSRIERNIRSSYSSGKKIQAALSSIHGHTQNNSAEDFVLLGSLKKKWPFFKPSPIGQKNSMERYREISRDNYTDDL